jgi:WD40 repeat protein
MRKASGSGKTTEDLLAAVESMPMLPLSPRASLAARNNKVDEMSLQVMLHLNNQRVNSMARAFKREGGKVDVKEFIRIMIAHLPEYLDANDEDADVARGMAENTARHSTVGPLRSDPRDAFMKPDVVSEFAFAQGLIELFKEIDINGDQELEWAEFVSFLVEKAIVFKTDARGEINDFKQVQLRIDPQYRHRHNNPLEKMQYLPQLQQLAVMEHASPIITLYNARNGRVTTQLKDTVRGRGIPTAMCYVERHKTMVVSCADSTMVAWDMSAHVSNTLYGDKEEFGNKGPQEPSVRSAWPTPHMQTCLQWQDRHDMLYSGSTAGTIHAWTLEDREERTCMLAHNDIVMDLCDMGGLNTLASGSMDTTIGIWDTFTGVRRQELRGHKMGVASLSYSPDHRMLLSAGFDHSAMVWSPFVPRLLYTLKGHSAPLVKVQAVEGGSEVLTADCNGYFKLWDLRNFQCVQTFTYEDVGSTCPLSGFVHVPPAKTSASLGHGWWAPSSSVDATSSGFHAMGHTAAPGAPPPSSSAALAAGASDIDAAAPTVGADGWPEAIKVGCPRVIGATKRLHFFDQGDETHEAVTDIKPVSCACYNANNMTCVTTSDCDLKVWDCVTGNVKRHYRNITAHPVTALCLDDRKRKVILGDEKGNIGVFNYANGALMKKFHPHNGEVSHLIYCDATKAVISVSGSGDRFITVHDELDPERGHVLRNLNMARLHTEQVTCVTYSHATSLVATGSNDRSVGVWDFETGKLDGTLHHGAPVTTVEFMARLPLLVAADSGGVVRVWGVRMTTFKYECCFSFLHGTPEAGVLYDSVRTRREDEDHRNGVTRRMSSSTVLKSASSAKAIKNAAVFQPTIKDTVDPISHKKSKQLVAQEKAEKRAAEQLARERKEKAEAEAAGGGDTDKGKGKDKEKAAGGGGKV